jgi:UDP-N-acetylmuramoyl-tripeptide--D-alanyl-D-alanine ligase
MKNFLAQILSLKFKTYATPKSVNTLKGIIKDINEFLPSDADVYIVEAGAREKGDILEIASFLNPHYVIVGKIGEQHIEYFKNIKNIIDTKLELLASKRLRKAFVYKAVPVAGENIVKFGDGNRNAVGNLEGTEFELKTESGFKKVKTPVLGDFNSLNIEVCFLVAKELGIKEQDIIKKIALLKPVEHRLEKIETDSKMVIDDSYNANIEGVLSSFELAKTYRGRKVLVTAGVLESTEKANEKIAKKADEIFDLIIVTSKTNRNVFNKNLQKAKKIFLKEKKELVGILKNLTKRGDLILFSNDAPEYL